MDQQQEGTALSVEVSADGAKAHVGNSALKGLGDAMAWLCPVRDAKVKITRALGDRVSAKIAAGDELTEQEGALFSLVFHREQQRLFNVQEAAARVEAVMADVKPLVLALPPIEDRGTTETFVRRAETIAADIHEDDVRELFARVVAGELCRPGAFSIRTLETIRSLDPAVAVAFNRFRAILFDGEWFLGIGFFVVDDAARAAGWSHRDEAELFDAGLLASTRQFELPDVTKHVLDYGPLALRLRARGDNRLKGHLLAGCHLTRTGREIASVLPPRHDREFFFAAARWLAQDLNVEWRESPADDWQPL